jgi:thiol-disulfide isomerase/thioredoxin
MMMHHINFSLFRIMILVVTLTFFQSGMAFVRQRSPAGITDGWVSPQRSDLFSNRRRTRRRQYSTILYHNWGSSHTSPQESSPPYQDTVPGEIPASSTTTTTTSSSSSSNSYSKPGKVQRLHSVQELLQYIDEAPTNSLSVVKFYTQTCPLCKKIALPYQKMARVYSSSNNNNTPSTTTPNIRFAEIDKAVHSQLCTTLGIDRFPYLQIYRNGQCVASHGTESDKTFAPLVNDTIQRELSMTNDDWKVFLTTFEAPIGIATAKFNQVRLLL